LARQNDVVSLDGDQFRSRTCTSYTLHGTRANAEGIGEQGAHLVGGCAIGGSGPHAHLKDPLVGATDCARTRSRMYAYGKSDHVGRTPGPSRVERNRIELF
jgi:hypothetical protein